MIGINGLCSVYDPPVSYWCSEHPRLAPSRASLANHGPRSGGGAFAFRTPSGITPKAGALPNLPSTGYAHPEDAFFFVWRPARWVHD